MVIAYGQVASGDADWIKVAVALTPGSDAGSASELNDALAFMRPHVAIAARFNADREGCREGAATTRAESLYARMALPGRFAPAGRDPEAANCERQL